MNNYWCNNTKVQGGPPGTSAFYFLPLRTVLLIKSQSSSSSSPMAAELAAAPMAAEIYSPNPSTTQSLQIWKILIAFLSFVSQILLQIHQLLSFFGIRHHSLLSPAFKPLPPEESPPPPPLPKLTVVLDLDETLVCAYETSSLPDVVKSHAINAGVNCFEIECLSIEKDDEGRPKVTHVTVFERPGLREFLMKISEFANLVLFTAGLEGYARPLVDRIDVDKKFGLRLYRPSTVSTEYREHVKDLTCLSEDLCRTVIVDNNPFSFLLQPLNGIPCVPFSAGQPHDEQLLEVILPLLKDLLFEKDVRTALYEKFHMPEWFQQHGIPTPSR